MDKLGTDFKQIQTPSAKNNENAEICKSKPQRESGILRNGQETYFPSEINFSQFLRVFFHSVGKAKGFVHIFRRIHHFCAWHFGSFLNYGTAFNSSLNGTKNDDFGCECEQGVRNIAYHRDRLVRCSEADSHNGTGRHPER